VVAGVLRDANSVLLTQRHKDSHLGGSWEFPGGKVEAGEAPVDALRREWREELGVQLSQALPWTFAHHPYPEKTVLILFYRVECREVPSPQEGQNMRWVSIGDLGTVELPEADRDIVKQMLAEDGSGIS
jgi:8-oxo-dGTP diphosphatase